jgi:hypothetical protein
MDLEHVVEAVSLIFLLQFLLQAFLQRAKLTPKSTIFALVVKQIETKSIHHDFLFQAIYMGITDRLQIKHFEHSGLRVKRFEVSYEWRYSTKRVKSDTRQS